MKQESVGDNGKIEFDEFLKMLNNNSFKLIWVFEIFIPFIVFAARNHLMSFINN